MRPFRVLFYLLLALHSSVCPFNDAAASGSTYFDDYMLMEDETETFIKEIINKIKKVMKYESDIDVYISSSQMINAAATQGGDIVVNAGAVLQCADVYELIAILAHETGHVAGGHIATYLAAVPDFARAGLVTLLIGAAASMVTGRAEALGVAALGAPSVVNSMALGKLRQKERIADTKAALAVEQLGWWPVFNGFISIHNKLAAHSYSGNEYFMTHPNSEERIEKYKAKEKSVHGKLMKEDVAALMACWQRKFEKIQKKLRALILTTDEALSLYATPKNKAERNAKAIALYRANKYADAIKEIDSILNTEKDFPGEIPYYVEIKAMCLINLGKHAEAARICWENLKHDRIPHMHRDLAIIYAAAVVDGKISEHTQNAIQILKKIRAMHENLSAVNMLGKLYTLAGKTDEASLCAADAAALIGDKKAAILHAKRVSPTGSKSVNRRARDILATMETEETEKDLLG